jgi:hypothetical protein
MIKKKPLTFFNLGVNSFRNLTGLSEEIYICPICGRGFDKNAVYDKILTVEHAPPKSMGGKGIALTCVCCNRDAGHRIDASVKARNDQFRFIEAMADRRNTYSGRVRLGIAGETLNFDLSIGPARMEMVPVRNDPKAKARWLAQMKQYATTGTWDGTQFTVTSRQKFHMWRSKVGDLKTAYLLGFAAFGYRWAFNHRLDLVRKQIRNPDDKVIDGFWLFLGWNTLSPKTLALVQNPFEFVYVCLGRTAVILPWVTGPPNVWGLLRSRYSKGNRINLQMAGTQILWPDRPKMLLDSISIQNKELRRKSK